MVTKGPRIPDINHSIGIFEKSVENRVHTCHQKNSWKDVNDDLPSRFKFCEWYGEEHANNLLEHLINSESVNRFIRESNPAVKAAWDEYQLLLRLSK